MDLRLPNLGEGADSGTVVNLFVKEGDQIEKDQPVIELENEKAVASIPATVSGVVGKIYVKAGDKIGVGQKILEISESKGGGNPAPAKPAATAPQPAQPAAAKAAPTPAPDSERDTGAPPTNGPIAAAPSLRKMAAELGIDLNRVHGSGSGGRILLTDVRAYIQKLQQTGQPGRPAASAPQAESIDFSKWGKTTRQPMSPLRKVISRRMLESWNSVPRVTQFDEADLSSILELRKKHLAAYEKKGARLTVTGFVLQAVAATLKKHPIFNTSLDEAKDEVIFKEYFHIGIAVDTEAGLIVPVIRDVDKKSLADISKELEDLAKKARDRKVSAEELKGGTFTISNQGGIGGAHFTPIVNKPEAAILGLGKGALKPVVRDGKIEPRMMLPMALSYDHRIIDGGSAARFIVDLVAALERFDEKQVVI